MSSCTPTAASSRALHACRHSMEAGWLASRSSPQLVGCDNACAEVGRQLRAAHKHANTQHTSRLSGCLRWCGYTPVGWLACFVQPGKSCPRVPGLRWGQQPHQPAWHNPVCINISTRGCCCHRRPRCSLSCLSGCCWRQLWPYLLCWEVEGVEGLMRHRRPDPVQPRPLLLPACRCGTAAAAAQAHVVVEGWAGGMGSAMPGASLTHGLFHKAMCAKETNTQTHMAVDTRIHSKYRFPSGKTWSVQAAANHAAGGCIPSPHITSSHSTRPLPARTP